MTPQTVPVASNLLESTFIGYPVRRLLQAFVPPLAPAAVLYAIPLVPVIVTTPVVVVGLLVGATIYRETPVGQQPLPWALARLRHRTHPTVHTWQPPATDGHMLTTGTTQDEWLTRAVAPVPPDAASHQVDTPAVEDFFVDTGGDVEHVPAPQEVS